MNKTSFSTFSDVATRWLDWQCKMIADIKIGTVFLKNSLADEKPELIASWPESRYVSMHEKLSSIAKDTIDGRQNSFSKISCKLDEVSLICDVTVIPLHHDDELIGCIVFLQPTRSAEHKKAVSQLFGWGVSWLESTLKASFEEESRLDPLVTNLTKLSLADAPLVVSTHEVCNLLSSELGCTRVSLGIMKGLQVDTLAISNQLRFDARSAQIRSIESAMEEAIDQQDTIFYPQKVEKLSLIAHKHKTLSASNDAINVISIPFSVGADSMGAITLLREKSKPFSKQEIDILKYATELLGAVIALKIQEEKTLLTTVSQSFTKSLESIFSKEYLLLKVSSFLLVLAVLLLSFFKTDYYIYASSNLEGKIVQVIVAPQDSFIKEATVRAGDMVEKNQMMVSFDDRDLQLEYEKLRSERGKVLKEYQETLALRERAKMSILLARISQVDARLALMKERLKRVEIKAPFTGIVVSGDLSHSFGSPVSKGDQLFEITPKGDYRVMLNVNDYDVSKLQIEQLGSLRLVSLPHKIIPIRISKIIPVSEAKNGANYFRVEATILDTDETILRPGMEGISKVKISDESLLWIWTHTIVDRARLWLWSVGL